MTTDRGPDPPPVQLFGGPADGMWVPLAGSGFVYRYQTLTCEHSPGEERHAWYTFETRPRLWGRFLFDRARAEIVGGAGA